MNTDDMIRALRPLVADAVARAIEYGSVTYFGSVADARGGVNPLSKPIAPAFELELQPGNCEEWQRGSGYPLPGDGDNLTQWLRGIAPLIVNTAVHNEGQHRVAYCEVVDGNLVVWVKGGA